jgi:hypothetical protein
MKSLGEQRHFVLSGTVHSNYESFTWPPFFLFIQAARINLPMKKRRTRMADLHVLLKREAADA